MEAVGKDKRYRVTPETEASNLHFHYESSTFGVL